MNNRTEKTIPGTGTAHKRDKDGTKTTEFELFRPSPI